MLGGGRSGRKQRVGEAAVGQTWKSWQGRWKGNDFDDMKEQQHGGQTGSDGTVRALKTAWEGVNRDKRSLISDETWGEGWEQGQWGQGHPLPCDSKSLFH